MTINNMVVNVPDGSLGRAPVVAAERAKYLDRLMEGSIIDNITENLAVIGHFHSAGVPGRHELTDGELNYREIDRRIGAAGYTGPFGLEYTPALSDHADSLRRTRRYLDGQ